MKCLNCGGSGKVSSGINPAVKFICKTCGGSGEVAE